MNVILPSHVNVHDLDECLDKGRKEAPVHGVEGLRYVHGLFPGFESERDEHETLTGVVTNEVMGLLNEDR